MQNEIIDIIQYALDNPYEFGTNDCNIMVMRMVDLIAGTNTADRKYSNSKEGIKSLKADGYAHTGEIVLKYCDEVEFTIDGDVWLDDENPLIMGIVASNRLVGINEEHNKFILTPKPSTGKYYRVRKQHG
ncbi:MAG: ornithine carbamoyltransferase [Pantoea eucrina]|jgi:hypothetical protein|nr:ornithine carbamoyltransferase [Pantoea eucrina]